GVLLGVLLWTDTTKDRIQLEKYLWGDSPFWSASYFCATTGSVSMETVKKYIEEQRTEEHKRKYMKSGKYKKQKS
ncbi:transposase, partial [Butyrivibrio sp. AE3009]|uniref:transposase n=1 Tax=Butyrivibrio sp. AE3009 TaxID=1280666 RepID=UPI0003B729E3